MADKLSKSKLEKAKKLVKSTFEDRSKGHNKRVNKLNKYQKMWLGEPIDRHYKGGMANLTVQESHKAVETFVANLKSLRTAIDPSYEVIERDKIQHLPEDKDRLRKIQLSVDLALDKSDFDDKYERDCRNCAIEGTLVYKVIHDMTQKKYGSYEIEKKDIPVFNPGDAPFGLPVEGAEPVGFNVERKYLPVEITETFDSPNYISKDLRYIYLDPKVEDFEKQTAVIELEKDVPFEELQMKKDDNGDPYYTNLKKIKDKILKDKPAEEKSRGLNVDLIHYWGKFDPDGNGITSEYCIICEKKTWEVIFCAVNWYDHGTRPYRLVKFIPKKGSAFGLGICELMFRQQVELNDNRNQIADNKTFQNAPMFINSSPMPIEDDQLTLRPFGVIEAGTGGRLEPLKINNFIDSAVLLERLLKDDFRTATGATVDIQGIGPGADTLGQSEILLKQGLHKMSSILDRFERDLLQQVYTLYYQLIMQYVDRQWELAIGGSMQKVDKYTIFADVAFKPNGSKYIQEKLIQRQQDVQLFSITSQHPSYQAHSKLLLKEIFKGAGREQLFEEAEELTQQQQAQPGIEGGGAVRQSNAGLSPQTNSAPNLAAVRRSAGAPQRNAQGGGL